MKNEKLWTVVVTDFFSDRLLMVASIDELCLRLSFHTKIAHYYSCSRKTIWVKGSESGNLQLIQSVYYDCDCKSLNFRVIIMGCGRACHTLRPTCFYRQLW
ncbi:MAG: phosphoribosyl-AMP cyclohydrolase [Candidatus Hodgkinia cicadicola]